MATTRFYRTGDNKIIKPLPTSTFPRIINGDSVNYSSPPALVQDSQYPASNLQLASRYTPWVIPPGSTTPHNLQIDLGSNQSISFAGFFALRQLGVQSSIPFDIGFRTAAQGYLNTTYTSAVSGTVGSSARDQGFLLPVGQLGRYWQFSLTSFSSDGLSIGALALCVLPQDLGVLYSPDMDDQLIHPTIQSRTGSGHLSVQTVGDDRRLVTMPFIEVTDAIRTKIDTVFGAFSVRDPVIWLDRSDTARQVVLANSTLSWRHVFDANNVWTGQLELEVLG